jgi:hypothetical protein
VTSTWRQLDFVDFVQQLAESLDGSDDSVLGRGVFGEDLPVRLAARLAADLSTRP